MESFLHALKILLAFALAALALLVIYSMGPHWITALVIYSLYKGCKFFLAPEQPSKK